ncbi:MAG: hypothetical protein JXQ83_06725, partial [Candidatus Glassbacteria bacterium]|nr:hypothetical protein [Candidatus Glassbacteria bacterium]
MKINLNIPLAEIYLLSVLWLPSLAAAPAATEQLARIDSARARVKNTISELEERVALTRSAGEFVEELGLFDNRVYGRVAERRTLQDDKVNTLNVQIENKSNMLEALKNTEGTYSGGDKDLGILDGDRGSQDPPPAVDQGNETIVKQLEGEIADLNRELNQLILPLEGGTELLDG